MIRRHEAYESKDRENVFGVFMARRMTRECADELQAAIHKRYKLRRSVLITSNRIIAGWDTYLGDTALTTTYWTA